jgi:hypothetical protein
MGDNDVRVRFPTLEIFAARNGGLLASRGRELLEAERRIARNVFIGSIDLDPIRIVEAAVANAPTTLGNYIRIAPGETIPQSTLVHELTHVWQYQTKGTQYISDSLWHQARATIATGSRNAAYEVTIVPGKSIHRYTAEQQAMIVEQYFSTPSLQSDPEYVRMIGEVRRARPIPASMIMEEAAFGPGGTNPFAVPDPSRPDAAGRTIPLFRLEF